MNATALASLQPEVVEDECVRFGSLVGASSAMRATFAMLERAAATDATVLIGGETGTGKEGAAESIHRAGARRDQPFLVVDCGAIPATLLDSELFGHEKGAFTGATVQRAGIFESADGGTVFLDEIGELPLELQPKLLRVLERREIRRVGGNEYRPVDVRIIAATHRDLRSEVAAGRFRADLYFRLAVMRVEMPALRTRPEDLPLLVDHFVADLGGDLAARARLSSPSMRALVARCAWPGNVRELRNFVERNLVMNEMPSPTSDAPARVAAIDVAVPFTDARRQALERFERDYLAQLLKAHGGVVADAARAAGIDRVYLYKLLRRHGVSFGRRDAR